MIEQTLEKWARRDRVIKSVARSKKADLGLRYFSIQTATRIEDAKWEPFQIEVLNNTETFSSYNKSRQIGMSFILAGDALFDAILNGLTFIMVSFNLEEATEKIVYAKQFWEAKHPSPASVPAWDEFDNNGIWQGKSPNRLDRWPEIVREGALSIEFDNGGRLISHPCRPPRGKRASVILDEFGHYQNDKAIFTAAFPMITRGRGVNRLTNSSTPLGAENLFCAIHQNKGEKYNNFVRRDYGWWEIDLLCTAEDRPKCIRDWLAGVQAKELARRYGTPWLHTLMNNNTLEDFLQEYNLAFLDSSHSFLSYDLIKSCYPSYWDGNEDEETDTEMFVRQLEDGYESTYVGIKSRCEIINDRGDVDITSALRCIDLLRASIENGLVTGRLIWTFDFGRNNDPSEIMVFEIKDGHINQRLMITMAQTDYDNQRTVLNHLLRTIPVTHGMVDRGGPGMGIAEELFKRFGDKATPIDFTNAGKDNWAKTLKKNMERKNVTIIPDRDQESQLHSIQRTYSTSNNVVYVVTSRVVKIGKKVVPHHADKFWTLAMGVWLGEQLINLNYSTPKLTTNVERKAKGASVQMAKKNFSVPRNRQLTNTRVGRSYYRNIMSKTGSMRNE